MSRHPKVIARTGRHTDKQRVGKHFLRAYAGDNYKEFASLLRMW